MAVTRSAVFMVVSGGGARAGSTAPRAPIGGGPRSLIDRRAIPVMDAEGLERAAEKIAARCRGGPEAIQPGVKLRTILETIESMIREGGAAPAFPAQTSRNECAACSSPTTRPSTRRGTS